MLWSFPKLRIRREGCQQSHTEVQALVAKLPDSKLPIAYRLLHALTASEGESPQAKFMRLSVDERRQLLSQQAEQMKTHYEQTAAERTEWQTGDFIDESETRGNLICRPIPPEPSQK